MNSSISSNDKISAPPMHSAGKGPSVKEKAKPASAAGAGIKTEMDSYVRSGGGDGYAQSIREELPQNEFSGESLVTAGDIYAFVEAYNQLPDALGEDFSSLRMEVYKPVRIDGGQGRQISLYEIGVAHSPDNRKMGALSINRGQLTESLKNRAADVHALFLQEDDGLLRRLSKLVMDMEGAEVFLRVCAGILYDRRNYD